MRRVGEMCISIARRIAKASGDSACQYRKSVGKSASQYRTPHSTGVGHRLCQYQTSHTHASIGHCIGNASDVACVSIYVCVGHRVGAA
eukprot:3583153-Rhodomonas_salina.7